MRTLFGTDGIRGEANKHPMTCEVALALGRATTHYFKKSLSTHHRPLIIVGKDTRRSCYMLEQAFSAGVCSQGGRVILTGPLPTPGVAFVTKSMRADAGVVISASHNKYTDNGIKIFNAEGYKVADEVEIELENMIFNPTLLPTLTGADLGRATRLDEVLGRYIVYVKSAFSNDYNLDGLRIVLDCANGAAYKIAPTVFRELGGEVFPLGVSPDGTNINDYCGALYPNDAKEELLRYRADIGICLDGDADRVQIIDHMGQVVHGDRLIALFVKLLLDKKVLKKGDQIVGTSMSNLGLEKLVKSLGLEFYRTEVGDRYIIEQMMASGATLGGEPSGHIIFRNHATTGDGVLAALKALEAMKFYKKTLHELVSGVELFPQYLQNIEITQKEPLEKINLMVEKSIKRLEDKGRVLLRYSGTENLLRVMVEASDEILAKEVTDEIVGIIKRNL